MVQQLAYNNIQITSDYNTISRIFIALFTLQTYAKLIQYFFPYICLKILFLYYINFQAVYPVIMFL